MVRANKSIKKGDTPMVGKVINPDALRHLIAVRAYEMWEEQGRPHGRDSLHWQQAEQDILACLPKGAIAVGGVSEVGWGDTARARIPDPAVCNDGEFPSRRSANTGNDP